MFPEPVYYVVFFWFQFVQDERVFPAGWSSQLAEESCTQLLQNSSVAKACGNVIDVNSSYYQQICVENIRVSMH